MHKNVLEKTNLFYRNISLRLNIFSFYMCIILILLAIDLVFFKLVPILILIQIIIFAIVPTFIVTSTYNAMKNGHKLSFLNSFKDIFLKKQEFNEMNVDIIFY